MVVAVIFVGVVAIGILMFSGDDTDDLALAYAQKASFYDCRTPLKDISYKDVSNLRRYEK